MTIRLLIEGELPTPRGARRNLIRLGLSQRLLLAVGLPLILELVLFSFTYILLDQTEQMTELGHREMKLHEHLNWAANLVSTFCWGIASEGANGYRESRTVCKQAEDQMPAEFAALESLFQQDSKALQLVRDMEECTDKLKQAGHTVLKNGTSDRASAEQITQGWFEIIRLRQEILKSEHALIGSIQSQLFSDRAGLKSKIKIGFFATMAISFLIAVYLAVNTINRLELIFKNAKAIGAGKFPTSRVEGNDELSYIDEQLYKTSKELVAALERERQQARTDLLSSLANRRAFHEDGERHMDLAVRHLQPLSVILLDIDHFKQFNDKYGHAVGDEIIKLIADGITALAKRIYQFAGAGKSFLCCCPRRRCQSARNWLNDCANRSKLAL